MKGKLVHPVVMWAVIIVGFLLINLILPAKTYLYGIDSARWLLIPAIAYFLIFFIGGFLANRQAVRSAARINKIIKSGVYKTVRHPIYSADIMLGLGILFYRPTLRMIACITWMIALLIFWMKMEEKILIERFGEEYRRYKKEVPMFLPGIKFS